MSIKHISYEVTASSEYDGTTSALNVKEPDTLQQWKSLHAVDLTGGKTEHLIISFPQELFLWTAIDVLLTGDEEGGTGRRPSRFDLTYFLPGIEGARPAQSLCLIPTSGTIFV